MGFFRPKANNFVVQLISPCYSQNSGTMVPRNSLFNLSLSGRLSTLDSL